MIRLGIPSTTPLLEIEKNHILFVADSSQRGSVSLVTLQTWRLNSDQLCHVAG